VALFSLLFVSVLYLTLKPDLIQSYWQQSRRGEPIARVGSLENKAFSKAEGLLSWTLVRANQKLYVNDRLFTEANSTARLLYNSGAEVQLLENSLVEVRDPSENFLDLQKGGLILTNFEKQKISISPDQPPVEIYNPTPSVPVYVSKNDKGQVEVQSSVDIEITQNSRSIKKGKSESIVLSQGQAPQVRRFPFQLNQQKQKSSSAATTISWPAQATEGEAFLEVAKTPHFTHILRSIDVRGQTELSVPKEAHSQFLRLRKDGAIVTEVMSVSPSQTSTLALMEPATTKPIVMETTDSQKVMTFRWKRPVQKAALKVWRGGELFQQMEVSGTTQSLELPAGEYQWQLDDQGEVSEVANFQLVSLADNASLFEEVAQAEPKTEEIQFIQIHNSQESKDQKDLMADTDKEKLKINERSLSSIEKEKAPLVYNLAIPGLVTPDHDTSVVTNDNLLQTPYLFSWDQTDPIHSYQFQLAQDAQFKKVIRTQKLQDNFAVVSLIPKGVYYWRVRSRKGLNASRWSDVRKVSVETSP
jgi:hypothetical protein